MIPWVCWANGNDIIGIVVIICGSTGRVGEHISTGNGLRKAAENRQE
jgi:hypothetical protein